MKGCVVQNNDACVIQQGAKELLAPLVEDFGITGSFPELCCSKCAIGHASSQKGGSWSFVPGNGPIDFSPFTGIAETTCSTCFKATFINIYELLAPAAIAFTKTQELFSLFRITLRVMSRFFYGLSSICEDYTRYSDVIHQSEVLALPVSYPDARQHDHSKLSGLICEAHEVRSADICKHLSY